jgi:hypothetical protein
MDEQIHEPERRYLSRVQAADYLGICQRSLDHYVVQYGLERIRLGKRVMFDKYKLDEFMQRMAA